MPMDPYQPLMYGFRNSPQYAAFQQVRANLQAEINHLGAIANNARASGLPGAAAALQGIIAAHTAQIRIAGAAAFQSYLNTLARTAIPEAIRALGLFFNNTIMPLLYHIPT